MNGASASTPGPVTGHSHRSIHRNQRLNATNAATNTRRGLRERPTATAAGASATNPSHDQPGSGNASASSTPDAAKSPM